MLNTCSRIVFQGDSITDGGRHRDNSNEVAPEDIGRSLGCGWPMLATAIMHRDIKHSIDVRNFGISGNRVTDLFARIREHGWNQQPDLFSILIGVNDTWHEGKRRCGVPVERYAKVYRFLLEETQAELPDCRLVLCDPFVLPCGVVEDHWRAEIDQRRAVVAELCGDFNAIRVDFQTAFDAAVETVPPAHLAGDGVHPTPAGHLLMARTWVETVNAAS